VQFRLILKHQNFSSLAQLSGFRITFAPLNLLMKSCLSKLATFLVAALLLLNCSEEDATLPIVTINDLTDLTQVSITLTGEITSDGGRPLIQKGFVWDTNPSPTIDLATKEIVEGNAIGLYSAEITGLTANTLYYVRPFASTAVGIAYGNERTFKTRPEVAPTVQLHSVTDIKQASAFIRGSIVESGSSPVIESGIVYGLVPNVNLQNNKVINTSGTNSINITLPGLTQKTIYYARIYAMNSIGVSYSDEVSFTTTAHTLPSVQTLTASNGTSNSILIKGNVIGAGTAPVKERGIVYSTSPQPTILNLKTASGVGIGNFSVELKGLSENTVYYARAYATNDGGTSYGSELSFKTLVSALPQSYLGDWYSLAGVHTHLIYDDEIILLETSVSYIYNGNTSITQVDGGYNVIGARIGWPNSPVTFYLKQGADKQAISIGSSISSTKSLYKVVARTLRRVTYGTGNASFSQETEFTPWIERNGNGVQTSWTFTETSRSDWAVFLTRNDGAKVKFDLSTKAVYFSPTSTGTLTKLYDMTGYFDY
jgi:hypothetical protein